MQRAPLTCPKAPGTHSTVPGAGIKVSPVTFSEAKAADRTGARGGAASASTEQWGKSTQSQAVKLFYL